MDADDDRDAPQIPLTGAQEGIWLGQQLAPASARYNAAECVVLERSTDVDALASAIGAMVAEAEILRTRFEPHADGPRQWIATAPFAPRRVQVGSADEAQAFMREDLARPIDLRRAGPYRGAIVEAPDRVFWYHAAHHVVLDGYGFAMLARRVAELYTAKVFGRPLPPAAFGRLQTVIDEEQRYRKGPACAADRSFWCTHLADMPQPATFAAGLAPVSDTVLRQSAAIAPALMAALAAAAKRVRGTWGDALIAAVALQLHRSCAVDEVVLGLPVMGRLGSAALRVPCMAMNVIPLRLALRAGDTFLDLIARVAAALRATRPHARYRYEQLRRDLGLVGRDKRLFGPVVNLMPFDLSLRFGEASARLDNLAAGPVEDLSIGVIAHGDAQPTRLVLDANPRCYDAAEIAAIARGLLATLEECVRAPEARVAWVAMQAVREEISWGPALGLPAEDVVDALAREARTHPLSIAIEDGHERVTYRELRERAQRLADRLAAAGIAREDLIAIALPRSSEAIVAMMGILSAGAGYLPIDVDGPSARNAAILDDAGAKLVVTSRAHRAVAAGWPLLYVEDEADGAAPCSVALTSDALAYVIYTSGSTGRPNGVAITRAALAHFVAASGERYGVSRSDRVLQFAPLHFDACVEEIYLTLSRGATLVLRDAAMLGSLAALMRAVETRALTILDLPTALFHELSYAMSKGQARLPACVRIVIIGGEAAQPDRVAEFLASAPATTRLINTYGPTEATVVATSAVIDADDLDGGVSIGAPLAGVGTLIVDAEGRPVLRGAVGELCLLGPTLARGYLGRSELTARRFVTLDAMPGRPRAYRTGDLVRRSREGALRFVGRVDDELKISGQRVDPGEIEAVLRRHPAVREACVVARGQSLCAHVVAAAPALTAAALRAHAALHLLPAAVPQRVRIVDALPKTSSGKIDRALLRAATDADASPSALPTSALEAQVLAIFAEVLGQPDIAPHDDFFARGGQSLQTIQVVNRLTIALSREVDVALVFRHPSAVELADALAHGSVSAASPAAAIERDLWLPTEVCATVAPSHPPTCVLLTGATGFVGVHALHALLEQTEARVVCLARGEDDAAAARRLRGALAAHGLFAPSFDARVRVLRADLSVENFGLGEQPHAALASDVDAIVHAAAQVSLTRGYASLRGANVDATRSILRFAATGRPKVLHHLSTIAVAHDGRAEPLPEAFVPAHAGLSDGYTQSKWAAEQLVAQAIARGIAASVLRLGRVVGPLSSGFVNASDIVWRTIRAGVPRGVLPRLDVSEPWTPVDFVARALVAIAFRAGAPRGVVNLTPSKVVRLGDVFAAVRAFGYDVRIVPVAEFVSALRDADDDDSTATRAFYELASAAAPPAQLSTIEATRLGALAGPAPSIDDAAIHRYLSYCVARGLLPPVSPASSGADQ